MIARISRCITFSRVTSAWAGRVSGVLFVLAPLMWLEAKTKPTPVPVAPAGSQDGFKSFHYVKVRNIFDPNRRRDPAEPGSTDASANASRSSESRGAPYLALVGVLTRPEKQLGFFTGSSGDYQKIVGAGQTIGAYKVKNVTMAGVEMERDGKAFTLPVGSQIRFDAAGVGTIQAAVPEAPPSVPIGTSSTPGDASSTTSSSSSSSSNTGAPASASDVLKRMMERRQQELSK
jgi:hypothetical protein